MAKPSAFFIGKLKVLKAAKEVQPRLPEVGEKRFGCKAKRSAHGFVPFELSACSTRARFLVMLCVYFADF